jgi:hypothetical protein
MKLVQELMEMTNQVVFAFSTYQDADLTEENPQHTSVTWLLGSPDDVRQKAIDKLSSDQYDISQLAEHFGFEEDDPATPGKIRKKLESKKTLRALSRFLNESGMIAFIPPIK